MPERPVQNTEEQSPTVNVETSRRTVHEILVEASENGRQELERTTKALVFSGVAGGITMGLTGMSVAIALATLGEGPFRMFLAYLLYPVGFIAVIIGRAQLFTENTLYPVVLVLTDQKYTIRTLRLWAIVLASNVFGAALFAGLAVRTGALRPEFSHQLTLLGVESSAGTMATIFWSGIIGGWLIALVAWMVSASHWTIGQIAVVWLLTYVVGLGHFAHCIAASGEILAAMFAGPITFRDYLHWFLPALGGNIVGGVFIVSLLNWGQVKAGEEKG